MSCPKALTGENPLSRSPVPKDSKDRSTFLTHAIRFDRYPTAYHDDIQIVILAMAPAEGLLRVVNSGSNDVPICRHAKAGRITRRKRARLAASGIAVAMSREKASRKRAFIKHLQQPVPGCVMPQIYTLARCPSNEN